jgi:hypothetical protein
VIAEQEPRLERTLPGRGLGQGDQAVDDAARVRTAIHVVADHQQDGPVVAVPRRPLGRHVAGDDVQQLVQQVQMPVHVADRIDQPPPGGTRWGSLGGLGTKELEGHHGTIRRPSGRGRSTGDNLPQRGRPINRLIIKVTGK